MSQDLFKIRDMASSVHDVCMIIWSRTLVHDIIISFLVHNIIDPFNRVEDAVNQIKKNSKYLMVYDMMVLSISILM